MIGEIGLQNLHLKGLITAYAGEEDIEYYYTDSMAKGDCIIKFDHLHTEDSVEHLISVSLLNDLIAYEFIVYWSKPLEPLLIRSVVQQIIEFQANASKEEFIEFLKDMSTQYICSADQDSERHAEEVFDGVNFDLSILGFEAPKNETTNS